MSKLLIFLLVVLGGETGVLILTLHFAKVRKCSAFSIIAQQENSYNKITDSIIYGKYCSMEIYLTDA